jgi:hypothetical protein
VVARLGNVILWFALIVSALIAFKATMLLCVIVIGMIRGCQLCLDFDYQIRVLKAIADLLTQIIQHGAFIPTPDGRGR